MAVNYGLSQATAMRTPMVFLFSSQYGRTPLHLAANNGILDVVRYLCLMGANVEALTLVSTRQGQVFGLRESHGNFSCLKGTRRKVLPGNCILKQTGCS